MGLNEGVELGHEMAELAANRAGEEWRAAAYFAFYEYAKTHKYFATEQVREAHPDLAAPTDDRAWGAIALRAKRDDIITGHLWVRSTSSNTHGRVVTQWASKIYAGEQ